MLQAANLALRFLLELCVLAAVGYWGFRAGHGRLVQIGLGIGGPLLVAVIWGVFGAPGAQVRLGAPVHLLLELVVFGLGPVALYASRQPRLAGVFGLIFVVNRLLMFVWGQ